MIAIVTAYSDRDLKEQMFESLENTIDGECRVYKENGMKDGEMKTVNRLVRNIDVDWDFLVRADDDLFFSRGWVKVMKRELILNPDVMLIGGCRYPTHKILEERKNIYIMDIVPGNHWMLSRHTWEMYGPFFEDFTNIAEDVRFCEKIKADGFKVACMKDPLLTVHCGIKNIKGRGRTPYVTGYTQALADCVGAKTNA